MVFRNQKGETIVEVLISVAVLGLILSATYALANKSTQANRQSQERAEALNENTARIEQFKTFLDNNGDIPSGTFCVYEDDSGKLQTTGNSGFIGGIPDNADEDTLEGYPGQCQAGPDNRYHTAIKKDGNTYVITTRWFKVAGGGVEELSILYKTFKASDLAYNPDAGSQPTDIELPPPPDCLAGQYLDTSTNTCASCPAGFNSSAGQNVCTRSQTINGRHDRPQNCVGNCLIDSFHSNGVYWQTGGFEADILGNTTSSPNAVSYSRYYFSNVRPDTLKSVKLVYFNGESNEGTYPPPNYTYKIILSYPGGIKTVRLPIETGSTARTNLHTFTVDGLYIDRADPYIKVQWDNNYTNGSYDTNFGLDNITLIQTYPRP